MKVKRKQLVDILQNLKSAVSAKDIIEQGRHFIFTGDDIVVNNEHILIRYPFVSDYKFSVPAEELYKILSEMDCEEADIKIEDDNLLLQTKKIDVKLAAMTDIHSRFLDKEKKEWKKLPTDFLEAISFCSFSAGRDMTKIALTYLDVREDKVTSSDNYRITQYKMKSMVKDSFHFPAMAVKEVLKYNIIRYAISDAWLYFKTKDNVVFSCRRSTIAFPNIKEFLKVKGTEISLPTETKKAVNVSSILCQGEVDIDKKIDVEIKDGMMTCVGRNEIGSVKFSIKSKGLKNKEFRFGINPDFFKIILDKSTKVIIDEKKILFLADNFKHLISLF